MKKHINEISRLVNENVWVFVGIVLIVALFDLIPQLLHYLMFNPEMIGSQFDFITSPEVSSALVNGEQAAQYLSYSMKYVVVILTSTLILSSFTIGGFISYLNNRGDHENKIAHFFSSGLSNIGRVMGGYLLIGLIMLAVVFLSSIVISIILFAVGLGRTNAYNVLLVIIMIGLLLLLIFYSFTPFEIICTKQKVTTCLSTSVKKVKKVFWPLVGIFIVVNAVSFLLSFAFNGFNLNSTNAVAGILSTPFSSAIESIGIAFLVFPLYKYATEKLDNNEIDGEKALHLNQAEDEYPSRYNGPIEPPPSSGY
ncbi:MAG TPA: hypothetical protein PKV16_07645 [Caldisericia bacterium]|nr:hypothetical protein [Caldisericia bacterium]HPF49702.1 hypothetical protein [Caldisericia bacterium]HPI84525.1 hypothetical protein [Caldisericia bacterium]HPQ93640.1 hypothetical protein [Caldisericia bacterium]HRV74796.1 hypothetical protein [Caldisericia bacterium]